MASEESGGPAPTTGASGVAEGEGAGSGAGRAADVGAGTGGAPACGLPSGTIRPQAASASVAISAAE